MWQEYALLDQESQENPLLMVDSNTQLHNVPGISDEQLENQTMEAFRLLKVSHTSTLTKTSSAPRTP